jgi:hypothetical protein
MNCHKIKNTFKVPLSEWKRWSQRSRYIYNRIMTESEGRFVSSDNGYLIKVTAVLAVQANQEYECDNRRFP